MDKHVSQNYVINFVEKKPNKIKIETKNKELCDIKNH